MEPRTGTMDVVARSESWPCGPGEMAARLRAHDWTGTPLSPPAAWPEELKGVVSLMLASPLLSSVVIGPERVLLYNDAAAQFYGEHHPEALGRPLSETWPAGYATVAHLYDRAFAGEAVAVPAQPLDLIREGGEIFEAYLTPVRGRTGEVLAVHMTGLEIGARLRAEVALRANEARQAFLLRLGDTLRAERDAEAVIEAAARLVGEQLGASRVMFAEFDEARGVADIFHGWFADGAEPFPTVMRLQDYEGSILDDLRAGRTVRVEDAGDPALARPDLAAIAQVGVRALLSVPLLVGGRLVVNLSVHQHAPRRWSDDEVALVQEVAERLWADLVRARAEAALRESEARQAFLLKLGDALRAEPSADAVANRAIAMLREHMALDRCYVATFRMDEDRADITHQVGGDRVAPMPPPSACPTSRPRSGSRSPGLW
ncbi:GAF domain-containing protein [Rubellimicrobium roseum]|nr:GAF domain-containing protein [Rubellimicrobium roseum]